MFTQGDEFERYLNEHNIRIYQVAELTTKIRGFCYYDIEEYHVLINLRMDCVGQRKTLIHELIHIFEDHFSCSESDRNKCEREVKEIIKRFRFMYCEEYAVDLY